MHADDKEINTKMTKKKCKRSVDNVFFLWINKSWLRFGIVCYEWNNETTQNDLYLEIKFV